MNIQELETALNSFDPTDRLKALTALRNYDTSVAVPLLKSKLQDSAFLVRFFVATGLGYNQTPESFTALLELMKCDRDPNVRAEAANSLSKFGQVAASSLVLAFHQDDHWLLRRSILAALCKMRCLEELFDVCLCGLKGEDTRLTEAVINGFSLLAGTSKSGEILQQLLLLVNAEEWHLRAKVVRVLRKFDNEQARVAISCLMKDEDYRVVAVALEGLL